MKKAFLFLIFLSISILSADGQSLFWTTDFRKAQKESLSTKKPVFAYFTGSDWCTECLHFQKNILENKDFIAEVKDSFIFVLVDFPLGHTLSAKQTAQNKELKERLKVAGLPTIAIILPSDNAILMAASSSISPKRLASALIAETEAAMTLETIMVKFEPQRFNTEQLVSLYQAAKLVARKDWQEEILTAGLKKVTNTSFFLREKYRLLIQAGQKNSAEAQKIREALLASDPNNDLGHQLYVAVSDFETNIDRKEKNAAEPLIKFLNRYNKPEISWKVKAMLASYFISASEYTSARQYLQEALKEAPLEHQDSIKALLAKLPN